MGREEAVNTRDEWGRRLVAEMAEGQINPAEREALALINLIDSAIEFTFALAVVPRIQDAGLRERAGDLLREFSRVR